MNQDQKTKKCAHDHQHEHSHDHMHDHNHNHSHDHDHDHHHHGFTAEQIQKLGRSFFIGSLLNFIFVIIELTLGVMFGSVSLIADATHNFSDVIALILSWVGFKLNSSKSTLKLSYGYKKLSLVISVVNSLFLVLSLGYILFEAYERFIQPQPVSEYSVMVVAAIGIGVNFFSAYLFRHSQSDLNVRGAYLHLLQDAAISAGVVVAAILMKLTQWMWIDPVVAVLIVILILKSTFNLLKESFYLLIGGVPREVDLDKVKQKLLSFEMVKDVHDLHIWAISASEVALTAHIRINNLSSNNFDQNEFLKNITHLIEQEFAIKHITIQIEFYNDTMVACTLDKHCN